MCGEGLFKLASGETEKKWATFSTVWEFSNWKQTKLH